MANLLQVVSKPQSELTELPPPKKCTLKFIEYPPGYSNAAVYDFLLQGGAFRGLIRHRRLNPQEVYLCRQKKELDNQNANIYRYDHEIWPQSSFAPIYP
jgi:hypothetical protein